MWWLLPYVGYAAAASLAAGAVGYAAVTRLALVQRLLARALDRALRQMTAGSDAEYSVQHTETGGCGGGRRRGEAGGELARQPRRRG